MVAAQEYRPHFTPAEYLVWEEQQEFRHEYINGEAYAMTGGTVNHGQIAGKFITLLNNHLDDRGCRVLNSDVKIAVAEANSYLYPDLSVTCDERDQNASKFINHPCLIVEVLSPSTEGYDRGDKFTLYRRSRSLQEYILVSTNAIKIDIYRRIESDRWEIISYAPNDFIELQSIALTVPIEQIYKNIIFEPKA
jgi:Uma2 family endonuclease